MQGKWFWVLPLKRYEIQKIYQKSSQDGVAKLLGQFSWTFVSGMVSTPRLITMTMNYIVVDIQDSGEQMGAIAASVATLGIRNR